MRHPGQGAGSEFAAASTATLAELLHRIRHTLLPSLLVLQGGLVLRFLFVGAGQASHWSTAALR